MKNLCEEMYQYDLDIWGYKRILRIYTEMRNDGHKFSDKELLVWEETHKKYKESRKIFSQMLNKKSSVLVRNMIIQSNRYNNIDEVILTSLTSGVTGVPPEVINNLRVRFYDTITTRVSEYINSYEYESIDRKEYRESIRDRD
jgi:hypothetical protein